MFKIQQSSKGLDFLKLLALVTMVLDHFAIVFFVEGELFYTLFRVIGRIAFPLFIFILVYNWIYNTRNKKKYIVRLFIFAIISEPVYRLVIYNNGFNIFWSLGVSLLFLYFLDKLLILSNRARLINSLSLYINFVFISTIFFVLSIILSYNIAYSFLGLCVTLSFYIWIKKQKVVYLLFVLFSLSILNFNFFNPFFIIFSSIIPIGAIFLSSYFIQEKKRYNIKYWNKYFFYLFYPLHLILLGLIRQVFF